MMEALNGLGQGGEGDTIEGKMRQGKIIVAGNGVGMALRFWAADDVGDTVVDLLQWLGGSRGGRTPRIEEAFW